MGEEKQTIDIAMAMRCVGGLCGGNDMDADAEVRQDR